MSVYVDYAGASLPSATQLEAVHLRHLRLPLTNPHSRHALSAATSQLTQAVKQRILSHFGTSSANYTVVFTSNTSHSLHILAECFQFLPKKQNDPPTEIIDSLDECHGPSFGYLLDSHHSVVGGRELVRDRVDHILCLPEPPGTDEEEESSALSPGSAGLFVLTGASNFCGRKYPLRIVRQLQKRGWAVCLDAAALVPSSELSLADCQPDFVCISFYKMFGYPTGVAALLVHRHSEHLLSKKSFAGGTVQVVLPAQLHFVQKDSIDRILEEGTPDYYGIAALREGFEELDRCGGMKKIALHVASIRAAARAMLLEKKHPNGQPLIHIYEAEKEEEQGSAIAFNVRRADGAWVGFGEVEKMADLFGICLRTGCFCNAGACQKYLGLDSQKLRGLFESGKRCGDLVDLVDGKPVGAVRISFGRLSTTQDIEVISCMLWSCFLSPLPSAVPPLPSLRLSFPHSASLHSLFLYPIKSCRGIQVDSWRTSPTGLLYDRHLCIVSTDVTLTQKRCPSLCRVVPQIDITSGILSVKMDGEGDDVIHVSLIHKRDSGWNCASNIHSVDDKSVSTWLGDSLGVDDCHLIAASPSFPAASSPSNFSNSSPFLLINRSSVEVLSSSANISSDELISRFRANLILTGLPPFVEDEADVVIIGDVKFEVVGKCTRCQMICMDQKSGEKDPALIIALRNLRLGDKMTFGIYLREEAGSTEAIKSVLSVGQQVQLLRLE